MIKIQIFEPASCCAKDNCNSSSEDILRITKIIEALSKENIHINRFNLSSSPMEFVKNDIVHQLLYKEGVSKLPLTVLNDEIVITSRYPTTVELIKMLNLSEDIISGL